MGTLSQSRELGAHHSICAPLQKSAIEFEVLAFLFFPDFLEKGRLWLDQEMSLLSHVELSKRQNRRKGLCRGSSDLQQADAGGETHQLAAWREHHPVLALQQLFKCLFLSQQLGWR